MGHSRPFFIYFSSFQTNLITIFTTNKCEKCPSSIRCWDSNPRPLEHESPPMTTRPGLPPSTHHSLMSVSRKAMSSSRSPSRTFWSFLFFCLFIFLASFHFATLAWGLVGDLKGLRLKLGHFEKLRNVMALAVSN